MIITNEIYDKAVLAEEGLAKQYVNKETQAALELLRMMIAEYHYNAPKEPINIELEEIEQEAKLI